MRYVLAFPFYSTLAIIESLDSSICNISGFHDEQFPEWSGTCSQIAKRNWHRDPSIKSQFLCLWLCLAFKCTVFCDLAKRSLFASNLGFLYFSAAYNVLITLHKYCIGSHFSRCLHLWVSIQCSAAFHAKNSLLSFSAFQNCNLLRTACFVILLLPSKYISLNIFGKSLSTCFQLLLLYLWSHILPASNLFLLHCC